MDLTEANILDVDVSDNFQSTGAIKIWATTCDIQPRWLLFFIASIDWTLSETSTSKLLGSVRLITDRVYQLNRTNDDDFDA